MKLESNRVKAPRSILGRYKGQISSTLDQGMSGSHWACMPNFTIQCTNPTTMGAIRLYDGKDEVLVEGNTHLDLKIGQPDSEPYPKQIYNQLAQGKLDDTVCTNESSRTAMGLPCSASSSC